MYENILEITKEEIIRQYEEDEITEKEFINKMTALAYTYACKEGNLGNVRRFVAKPLIYIYLRFCWLAGRIARIFTR